MKLPPIWIAVLGLILPGHAERIAYESFDYAAASPLTGLDGGSGWSDGWTQDGGPVVAGMAGLGYTDAQGKVLEVAGRCADTSGTTTTRSFRGFGGGLANGVWISFLWRLPASNDKFEGVSFYRGAQQVLTLSNAGSTGTARITLTNHLVSNGGVNSQKGSFGTTHFVVLKMTEGGGTGGSDRVDLFIDPLLSGTPGSPDAVVSGSDFDIDRVRIAGQDGASLLVDELRIGETFGDVAPHGPAGSGDSDGDGLSDAQEAVLGLNPGIDDSSLVAAIREHPDWFDLHRRNDILAMDLGGVVQEKTGDVPVDFIFEVQHSHVLDTWQVLETVHLQIVLPLGKNFLRVRVEGR